MKKDGIYVPDGVDGSVSDASAKRRQRGKFVAKKKTEEKKGKLKKNESSLPSGAVMSERQD